MKKLTFFLLNSFLVFTLQATNISPEKVYPINRVQQSPDYYQAQIEAWSAELTQNPNNATAWLNYYTAARCANVVSKTSAVDLETIVQQMKKSLTQDKFEYYYIQAWQLGHNSPDYFQLISKAYEIDPDRYEVYDGFITHYEVLGNEEQVRFFCKKWLQSGEYSPGILSWNYNALMSVETNGLLLTFGDNTTYPIWLLQYGKELRPDVTTANIHLLKLPAYRKSLFDKMNIPELLQTAPQNQVEEEIFFKTLIDHILRHSSRPLYISMSFLRKLRERYSDNLYVVGLALKYSETQFDNIAMLRNNYENRFLTDYLRVNLSPDISSSVLENLNLNYIPPFVMLYQHYKESGDNAEADLLKSIVIDIAEKGNKTAEIAQYFPEERPPVSIVSSISVKDLDKNMKPIKNGLYAAATETSNSEYNQFLVDLAKNRSFDELQACRTIKTDWKSLLPEQFKNLSDDVLYLNGNPDASQKCPIQNISYEAAIIYCDWLTKVYNQSDFKKKQFKKVKFRLPTATEWQYAAEGGHIKAPFPWGGYYYKNAKGCYLSNANVSEEPPCEECDQKNVKAGNDGGFFTVNVDAFFPNDYGLFNVSGNVAEMTDEKGIAMGGSWADAPNDCQVSSIQSYDKPSPKVGFRVFMEVIEE